MGGLKSVDPALKQPALSIKGRRLSSRPKGLTWFLQVITLYRPVTRVIQLAGRGLFRRKDRLEIRLEPNARLSLKRATRFDRSMGRELENLPLSQIHSIQYSERNAELQAMVGMSALGLGTFGGVYWVARGLWAEPVSPFLLSSGCMLILCGLISEFVIGRIFPFGSRLSLCMQDGRQICMSVLTRIG